MTVSPFSFVTLRDSPQRGAGHSSQWSSAGPNAIFSGSSQAS